MTLSRIRRSQLPKSLVLDPTEHDELEFELLV